VAIRVRTELAAFAACALTLTRALEVRADAVHPALVVTRAAGAEDCPDAAGIATRVAAMAGTNPFELRAEIPRNTWVQIEFAEGLSGYRAVISAHGRRQGKRAIDDIGPGCTSLADAVAITLVMLLDPELARPSPEPVPAAPPPAVTPVRAPKAAPDVPGERSARSRRVSFGVEGAGGASIGILQHGSPFVEAGVLLRSRSWFSLATGGGFVLPDRVALPSGSVELGLWYAYLRASANVFEGEGSRIALFLGPSTGSLRGEGVDYTENPPQHLWWIAATFGAELCAALSASISWTARIFALTPLRYEGFYVMDAGDRVTAFRTPAVGGALSIGILAQP
jgi:hypothetical protein